MMGKTVFGAHQNIYRTMTNYVIITIKHI